MGFHIIYDDGVDEVKFIEESPNTSRVSMLVRIAEAVYTDTKELLMGMKYATEPAKTSCPSIEDYLQVIERVAENNDVYIVTLSSSLSASYSVALQAMDRYKEEHPNANICVFDSLSATAGETRVVLEILLKAEQLSFNSMHDYIKEYIRNYTTLFVIDNLDNLIKNGRLGAVEGCILKFAKIKFVGYASRDGEIKVLHKAFGLKAAYNKLFADVRHEIKADDIVVISNCQADALSNKLKNDLVSRGCHNVYMASARLITGVYGNAGSIEVSW